MREQIMQVLATALSDNLGNRLTAELATGIATNINQLWLRLEAEEQEKQPD